NRLSVVEPNNNTSRFTYDATNRLLTATNPLSKTYSYVYDAVGNRTRVTDANGAAIDYTYDNGNRLAQIHYPDQTNVTFTYDAASLLAGTTNANGTSASYVYDDAQRLASLTNTKSGGALISAYTFSLDHVGNRTGVDQQEPLNAGLLSGTTNSTYDAANRLQ